ncbi:MAG: PilZ domain-containing protein [Pyrinomonadaceae bacterium]
MKKKEPSRRIRERLELKLPVRVHCRETSDFEWEEITRLVNVTPFGAGFTLKRPIEKGRLVHMTIPMPRQLRVFDHVEDQYRVWALVRYARPLTSTKDKVPFFDFGVAFVGKRPPKSYEEDPAKRYEIAASAMDTLTEDAEGMVKAFPSSDERATRHSIPVDMLLETLNEKGGVAASESTVTENISEGGATIFTSFTILPGRFIRLTSQQYQLSVHAVVRSVSTGADGVRRMHVEFVGQEWPL